MCISALPLLSCCTAAHLLQARLSEQACSDTCTGLCELSAQPQQLKITYSEAVQHKSSTPSLKWVIYNISKWQFKPLSKFQHFSSSKIVLFYSKQISAAKVKSKSPNDQLVQHVFFLLFCSFPQVTKCTDFLDSPNDVLFFTVEFLGSICDDMDHSCFFERFHPWI